MKYYITNKITLAAGTRDYLFYTNGCHITIQVNGQVDFVLYNILSETLVYDIHTQLPVKGTLYANNKVDFYINPGRYVLNIGYASHLSGILTYQKLVDSNDQLYKLQDDTIIDVSNGLPNSIYPVNGRLCTIEDIFAEYHKDNVYYADGYYLSKHIKDKLVTYDMALNGLDIKLLTIKGYNINSSSDNPTSVIYKINPTISADEQIPPSRYLYEIINAIKEWVKKWVNDETFNRITINENTNIYDILSETLTYKGQGRETAFISDTELSTISENLKYNKPLTTNKQKEIFNTLLGCDKQESLKKCTLMNLLNYIATEYQFNFNNEIKSTLFPNVSYSKVIPNNIKNKMIFINAQGILQNGKLTYYFIGRSALTEKGENIKYGIIDSIEYSSNQQDCSFIIKHSKDPFTNIIKEFNTCFYNNNNQSIFTIKELYNKLYIPVWESIIANLVYNNVKIYAIPFNGSQTYDIPQITGNENTILHNKIVRICDLSNIIFKLYNINTIIYPWYVSSYNNTINQELHRYINKTIISNINSQPLPSSKKIETLALNGTPYTYYNAHTFSPLWKKKRGTDTIILKYAQYTEGYTVMSNNPNIQIYPVIDPTKYLLDPSANKSETQQVLREYGITLDTNKNTGIYGIDLKPATPPEHSGYDFNPDNTFTPTDTIEDKDNINFIDHLVDILIDDNGNIQSQPSDDNIEETGIAADEIINENNNANRLETKYYAIFPTYPNLTPNLILNYASLILHKNNNIISYSVQRFPVYQLPRQYVILFIFYKPIQSDNTTTYTTLQSNEIEITETSENYVLDLISSGELKQDNSLVNYPAIYQLFNIKCAYGTKYDMNFNITIKKTTEELKKVFYKTGIYFKGIDADGINPIKDDMRYIYDQTMYINDDKTLKIDRNELNTYIEVVDPNLPTISGNDEYNKISINGSIPQNKYTCEMKPLWPIIKNNVYKSITANVAIQFFSKTNN